MKKQNQNVAATAAIPATAPAVTYTSEQIQAMLATLSAEDLTRMANERKAASLEPMIKEYAETETKLTELKRKIQEINPDWRPASLSDRMVSWIGEQETAPTVDQIRAHFKTLDYGYGTIKMTLEKLTKAGTAKLDKDGKYTLNE